MHQPASLLIAAVLWPCIAAAQVPPAYHATPLGGGIAMAINNQGQVAGLDSADRPVVWSRSGAATLLTGQVEQASITGINDDGTVTGFGLLAGQNPGYYQPLVWRNGAGAQRLDLPGVGGMTSGINQRGDIVGTFVPPSGWPSTTVGFLKRDSGTVYFDSFYPRAINDRGDVLGDGDTGLAIWHDGQLSDVPFGCCGYASAINNNGWVVGASGASHAGLWKDGQYQAMWRGYAADINDAGMAVGGSDYSAPAVLWYQGQAYVLDHLWHEPQWIDWTLTSAVAINENGEIAAQARNVVSGDYMSVLLSPVPEPAMAWLLLLGLSCLSLARRSG